MSGLFGPAVAPAAPSPEVLDLGRRLPSSLRFGTSSWSFPGWTGLVWGHPTSAELLAREGLAAYAAHPLLRAVGVDRTFYGPVPERTFAEWAAAVPDGFRFLVKAHEHVTTVRFPNQPRYGRLAGEASPRFLDAAYAAEEVVGPAWLGLGDKLGVVLFQFPPTPTSELAPAAFAERLHAFLDALPRGPRYAVEIRTRGWLTPAYADALVASGVSHSYVAHPTMPSIGEQIRRVRGGARSGVVIRWMLRADLGYEAAKAAFAPFDRLAAPDLDTRGEVARLCQLALGRDKDVIVVINNKAEGSAPLSVSALAEAVLGG